MNARAREGLGLIGENGAGKNTSMEILRRALAADEGRLYHTLAAD